MSDSTRRQVIAHETSSGARFGNWLAHVNAAIDWRRLDRFLVWLERPDVPFRHDPVKLFKGLLVSKWCSLSALEFNHEIEDRRSFREFVGLTNYDRTMQYGDISSFRSLLAQRGIADELFAEIDNQVRQSGLDLPANVTFGLGALGESGNAALSSEWLSLENRVKTYWQSRISSGDVPLMTNIRLSELADIKDHLVLIRVLPDGVYRYEMVGHAVESANEGRLVGFSVNEKADSNFRRHDEQGLQKDLRQLFDLALSTRAPVSTSTYFLNAKKNKCRLFTALAPVENEAQSIEFLLGIASIKPVVLS